MYPILFEIGPFRVGSYGVMMAVAFLVTGWLVAREFRRKNIPADWAYSIVIWAAIGGIVGARLYFILEHWGEFVRNPVAMIFTGSGLTWFGGLIGGIAAVIWRAARFPARTVLMLDLIAPVVLLGYGIGRIGCFLAGDGDYGPPSDLPWAMAFPNGLVPTDVPVHPTPLYETLLSWLLFAILWHWRKKPHPPGLMISGMLVFYGLERFITEFWRLTPKFAGWMTWPQFLSLISIAIGLALAAYFYRSYPDERVQ
jgi:phosphatidylglycerol:prolipoprotein diacylglycerol transferase